METKICVVGLGYVGLPLACLLSKKYKVYGFDISEKKINNLKNGYDETGEVENFSDFNLEISSDPAIIKNANFIIVAVPTPVKEDFTPDISLVLSASGLVGQNLQSGSIVVYESTVYPGCTEEDCLSVLEKESRLQLNKDFGLGYSPERVNPGDKTHTIDKIFKIVSGSDEKTLENIAEVYGSITQIHKTTSIKVAEAAKVIENVQRDLNIALMNELALIFEKIGIDTKEVIKAASTKWNFGKYYPGLVGGHCIGVDPYYLTYKSRKLGYEPKIILAGREINEYMAEHVAKKMISKNRVMILGLTFKENIPDIRNSKANDICRILTDWGKEVFGFDPLVEDKNYLKKNFCQTILESWPPKEKFGGIIVFSPHNEFKDEKYSLENLRNICDENPIIFDIKGFYDKSEAESLGFKYLTL